MAAHYRLVAGWRNDLARQVFTIRKLLTPMTDDEAHGEGCRFEFPRRCPRCLHDLVALGIRTRGHVTNVFNATNFDRDGVGPRSGE
jgi:hypothetical protein